VSLSFVHARLSITAAVFTFVMGIWAAGLFARDRRLGGNYLGAVVVGELLLVAQSVLGLLLLLGQGLQSLRWVHILYGLLAVLVWPFLYTYTRDTPERATPPRLETILFAAGSLFLWGLVMRAITTAGGITP